MAEAEAEVQTQDPPRDDAVERFLKFLKENELSCESNGPKFVCINAVRTYLGGKRNQYETLKELLRGLFNGTADPPNHNTILSSDCSYVAMLCILTKLGKGSLIDHFVRKSLDDGQLPLGPSPHQHFPLDTGGGEFYEKFCMTQWMFCVPHFTRAMNKNFEPDLILPITKKTPIRSGGSATVNEIQIHACYNKFHDYGQGTPRKQCPPSGSQDETSNAFALKTYTTPGARKDYVTEQNAFRTLGMGDADKRHIVKFYGNYTHGDTYNIIMERADKSLEDYLEKQTPPSESEDIHKFWYNLLKILNALNDIHYVEQELNGVPRMLKGWHQDVKPANILVFSNKKDNPFEFAFKLADFGTSHFKKTAECGVESTDNDSYGTSMYGAPECRRSEGWEESSLRVKQKVDVWSFGCILSEAAVWLSKGYDTGVLKYRGELLVEASFKKTGLGTCFHDGTRVLDTVHRWHAAVRRTKRESDNITTGVLTIIEKEMLVQKPDGRPDPKCLWTKAEDLFTRKESTDTVAIPHNFPGGYSNSNEFPSHSIAPPAPFAPHAHPETPTFRNGVWDTTPSDWEITSQNYPRTHKYLQEQYQTIEKCRANVDPVEKILSLFSSAENSLGRRDPKTARIHVDEARKVVDTMLDKFGSENPNQKLPDHMLEQHLNAWTSMTKCELAIIDQAPTPLSSEDKEMHLSKAEKYANGAFVAQKMLITGSNTCEAKELLKGRRNDVC